MYEKRSGLLYKFTETEIQADLFRRLKSNNE